LIIIETRTRASCPYKTALMFPWSYPFRCFFFFDCATWRHLQRLLCVSSLLVSVMVSFPLLSVSCFILKFCQIVTRFVFLCTAFCFPKRDVNFKGSAVYLQSVDVVVTTTPVPRNQTTSAHTSAGGEVFFCEMYGFC